jgi:DMSO/TMAO reductase YedYZ molybdopterin-dependent catalytic subunit
VGAGRVRHGPDADAPHRFATSIPRRKAERREVLLAWDMNGAPLSALHGAPLRAVVPWDSALGVQPEHAATVWNPKAHVNSVWDRVRVTTG